MGVFDRFLKGKEPKPGSKEAKERFDTSIDEMMGIAGKAKISNRGYPVCGYCAHEFPISVEAMRTQAAGGESVFMCPSCRNLIRL